MRSGSETTSRAARRISGFRPGRSWWICALLLLLSGGVARAAYPDGQAAMRARDYPEAVRLLRLAVEKAPGDAKLERDLGIALLMKELLPGGAYQPGGDAAPALVPCESGPDGPGWFKTYGQDTRGDGRLYMGGSATMPDAAGAHEAAVRKAQEGVAGSIKQAVAGTLRSLLERPENPNREQDRLFIDSTIVTLVGRQIPRSTSIWRRTDCPEKDDKGNVRHKAFVVLGVQLQSVIDAAWATVETRLTTPDSPAGKPDADGFAKKIQDALGVETLASGSRSPSTEVVAAREFLDRASRVMPEDPALLVCLGAANERLGDLDGSTAAYRAYVRSGSSSRSRRAVEDRLRGLQREQSLANVRARIEKGDTTDVAPDWGPSGVAVAPLRVDGPSEPYGPLSWALAAWLSSDLAKVRSLTLMGPLEVGALLQDLRLVDADSTNATHLGRVLGVARMVTGSVGPVNDTTMRFELRVTDVATGGASVAAGTVPIEQLPLIEKDLLSGLLTKLNVQPTSQEQTAIDSGRTPDMNAILAYGRGLMAEGRGDDAAARTSYETAVAANKQFGPAVDALGGVIAPLPDLSALLAQMVSEFFPKPAAAVRGLSDRLRVTDQLTAGDLWPANPQDVTHAGAAPTIPDPPGLPPPPGTIPDPPNPPPGQSSALGVPAISPSATPIGAR